MRGVGEAGRGRRGRETGERERERERVRRGTNKMTDDIVGPGVNGIYCTLPPVRVFQYK